MEGMGLAAPLVALLFGGHLFYGADGAAASLAYAGLAMALAAAALLLHSDLAPLIARKLRFAGPAFALVLILGIAQLFPPLLGDPHPFWAFVEGGAAATLDRDATERELLRLTGLAALFLAGMTIGLDDRRASTFFRLFLWGALAYSVWAFAEFIVDPDLLYGQPLPNAGRLTGSFLFSNTAATVFGCLLLICLGAIIRRAKTGISDGQAGVQQFVPPVIAALFAVTCLALTASRAGLVSASAGVLFLLCWELVSQRSRTMVGPVAIAAGAILAAGVVLWGLSGDVVAERFSYAEQSMQARLEVFAAHWEAIRPAFWSGYGLGTFGIVNDYLQTAENLDVLGSLGSLHNVYLQWLEEGGALISAAMWACLGAVLFEIASGAGVRRRNTTWLRVIVALSLAILLHGAVDYGLEIMSVAGMWAALLGVGLGLSVPSADRRR